MPVYTKFSVVVLRASPDKNKKAFGDWTHKKAKEKVMMMNEKIIKRRKVYKKRTEKNTRKLKYHPSKQKKVV